MNLRAKFVFSIGWLGLMYLILLPGSLRADTIYTYTGNPYNTCYGTYCTGGPYALSVKFDTTLTGSALDNLNLTDITGSISTFSFTDANGLNLNQTNADPSNTKFLVTTDSSGNITAWDMYAYTPTTAFLALEAASQSIYSRDVAYQYTNHFSTYLGYGFNLGANPNTWTSSVTTTATPEPSTNLLFGTGILGLLALAARSKRQALPT